MMTKFKILGGAAVVLALTLPALGGEGSENPTGPTFVPPFVPPFTSPVFVPQDLTKPSERRRIINTTGIGTGIGTEISPTATTNLIRGINSAQTFCARLPDLAYRIDCLSNQLEQVADAIPDTGEYTEAKQIVQQAARKLNATARRNASPSKRPANLRAPGVAPQRSTRPIVPIRPERLAQATAEAVAIVEEAETLLLRASQTSERRKVAYQQIALAVGSTKVLLRAS